MAYFSDTLKCRCGGSCDRINEEDQIRVCDKCGSKYERKNYGWNKIEESRLA